MLQLVAVISMHPSMLTCLSGDISSGNVCCTLQALLYCYHNGSSSDLMVTRPVTNSLAESTAAGRASLLLLLRFQCCCLVPLTSVDHCKAHDLFFLRVAGMPQIKIGRASMVCNLVLVSCSN